MKLIFYIFRYFCLLFKNKDKAVTNLSMFDDLWRCSPKTLFTRFSYHCFDIRGSFCSLCVVRLGAKIHRETKHTKTDVDCVNLCLKIIRHAFCLRLRTLMTFFFKQTTQIRLKCLQQQL